VAHADISVLGRLLVEAVGLANDKSMRRNFVLGAEFDADVVRVVDVKRQTHLLAQHGVGPDPGFAFDDTGPAGEMFVALADLEVGLLVVADSAYADDGKIVRRGVDADIALLLYLLVRPL
jgi:hypothetical protein